MLTALYHRLGWYTELEVDSYVNWVVTQQTYMRKYGGTPSCVAIRSFRIFLDFDDDSFGKNYDQEIYIMARRRKGSPTPSCYSLKCIVRHPSKPSFLVPKIHVAQDRSMVVDLTSITQWRELEDMYARDVAMIGDAAGSSFGSDEEMTEEQMNEELESQWLE